MPVSNDKLYSLNSQQRSAIANLIEMRLAELTLVNENPSVIAMYEGALARIGGPNERT